MKTTMAGLLGRVLMSLGTVIAGFVPLIVDLSPTHVFNPAWSAHARFHEVWLLATGGLLAVVTFHFIWLYRKRPRFGITLAGVLISVLFAGYFLASATTSLYGGILIDPDTAPIMPNQGVVMGMPANSFLFGLGWLLLLFGVVIARSATPASELA